MAIHYSNCPACQSTSINKVLSARDHTVSQEVFDVWHCNDCTLRFTQDVPTEDAIGPYYQSEEYVSHSNSDKGLINGLYQRVRNITLGQKRNLIREVTGLNQGSLLDLGCGTGEFLHTMQNAGWNVKGLEPDEGARTFGQQQYKLSVGQPHELFELDQQYDCITLWHVLEHVHQLHENIEQLKKLLKPNGKLIIAVPNYTSSDASKYKDKWAAYDVPRHLYHFSPKSMKNLLKLHQLDVYEMRAMPFDAFYVSLLSEKYTHGKMRPVSAFFAGLQSWWPSRSKPTRGSSVMYFIQKEQ